MDITELESIQGELERLHDRCERGILLLSEISPILSALDQRARAALPAELDISRLYDSRMRAGTDWWRRTVNGYVAREDCRNIGRRIAVLREVLKEIEPEFLRAEQSPKTQLYFTAGEVYRARQEFYRLLRRASTRVDVADPHLDLEVFDFVEALEPSLSVRLLTGTPKKLFVSQIPAIQATQPRVQARSSDQHHDRWAILDGSEVWHLGASINGLGKKACMINKVTDEAERTKVVTDFEKWWDAGTAV